MPEPTFSPRETTRNIDRETLPTLETIDRAVWDWLNGLDLFATCSPEDGGFKKVPVFWVGAEMPFQTKVFRELRDVSGSVMPPVISIQRKSTNKDLSRKGQHWANVPAVNDFMGGVFTVKRELKHKKTSEFINAEARRLTGKMNYKFDPEDEIDAFPVYEYYSVPIPVYVENMYSIKIWTLYMQQQNEIVQPFLTQVPAGNINRFVISHDGHNFEAFMEGNVEFGGNMDSLEKEERKLEATINVKVLGHIVGEGTNQSQPYVVKREGPAKVEIVEIFEE